MTKRKITTLAILASATTLAGCTYMDRNQVAVALCGRTAGCTVSDQRERYGPEQVRIMEKPRKPVTTEKK